jgi:hypothetical protein
MDVDVVTAPSAGSSIIRRTVIPPKINTIGRSTYVRNTELLSSIGTIALGAFNTSRGRLIPGNLTWLTGVASNFSKWRWHFLKIVYVPVCPTVTTGQVVMCLGYDATDVPPTTLVQAQSTFESVTAPVWAGFNGTSELNTYKPIKSPGAVCINVDVTRLGGATGDNYYRFITNTNIAAQTDVDKNIFCPGHVDISTAGGVALVVGNVFLEYVVELIEPIPFVLNF